ncbi:MAG: transposase [Oligoflexales bacterium]
MKIKKIYAIIPYMYPRRLIIQDSSFTHVFFRCHNRQFLLKPKEIKEYLLSLGAKFKKKYGILIYDFIIMDNHAHLLLKVPNQFSLSNFMRTVNSLLARFINNYFKRDSQAIRERFKSPIVSTESYFLQLMPYIWLNRFKVDGTKPNSDLYCSACWRINPACLAKIAINEEEYKLFAQLLDTYESANINPGKSVKRFVLNLLNAAMSKISMLKKEIFENSHTIGDVLAISFRAELLAAFRRETVP